MKIDKGGIEGISLLFRNILEIFPIWIAKMPILYKYDKFLVNTESLKT
jgi:hypothetical protein